MTAVVGVLLDELRGLMSVEHDGTITWDELQELKNKYFGPDVVAIEVYPPHSNVVNSLPMRHLWKLGAGEYWPDLTGQRLVGDLTLRDREILTRTELEFHQQKKAELVEREFEERRQSMKRGARRSDHRFKLNN
ncbi:DUF7694 domain-containing protein [Brucella pseudogrignonensis]|uniref:DUF7694 domain-containing protein n=1 Tax=Brucella pseudogrignonensis TaxID=419475 RepID=A0A256GEU9_9HYPH|nr:hypothetical protein [Brucella pseudogrignonensis]OYR25665.1 hypothetical protein CEV34_2734 [Brucella pseudogrignonensis]